MHHVARITSGEFPKVPDGSTAFDIRVFIATPAYDGRNYTDYTISIAETATVTLVNGVFPMASIMGNGAFIDVSRNHFVRMFLESNATHLFFIDADLRWEPRAFIELARSNLPICAGIYRKRQEPEEYPMRFVANDDGTILTKDGWVMADRVAGGFLCIRRDVIERMKDEGDTLLCGNDPEAPLLFYEKFEPAGPKKKRLIGEDFAFCDDYVRIFKEFIPVWPDFNFSHAGFKGNLHQFLLRKSKESEADEAIKRACATSTAA